MELFIILLIVFSFIVFSIIKGIFIGYPLILFTILISVLALKKGFSSRIIFSSAVEGGKKSLIVLQVFFLIGMVISLWISAGTIPAIVYYGIKLINPNFFILCAFLITSFVSFLLGTSLGSVGTIGIALIILAKSSDINLSMVAGAILSGAYFGDRCSPMSSSAILVANLTKTNLFDNIKKMFITGTLPFILSCTLYLLLSIYNPISFKDSSITKLISDNFSISFITLLPALVMLGASLIKIPVKKSMTLSIVISILISIFIQGYSIKELLSFAYSGFFLDDGVFPNNIFNKGGILSMTKAGIIVFTSCTMAGILDKTSMLSHLEKRLNSNFNRVRLFITTIITSLITSMFGCNQTISIVLTEQLLSKTYTRFDHSRSKLSIDLENTAIVIAPLIPWNIAAFIPTTTLGVSFSGYIIFAFYLYLIPLSNLINEIIIYKNKNRYKSISTI